MIRKGDRVTIRPQWRDPGDETRVFIAMEDESGGRVEIIDASSSMTIKPTQIVETRMLETADSD